MPEYLAPAVYVEEVDTGSKPIEGVSTSTAGMVGVTERGPVNVPMLVTGLGEYQRVFGGTLNPALFGNHCFLPHAVEGFFTNGGKRVFVTRVLDAAAASAASRVLVAPDAAAPMTAHLLGGAAPGATSVVIVDNPGFAGGDTAQVGDGAEAEFHGIGAVASPPYVGMNFPLSRGHANPEAVQVLALTAVGAARTLNGAVQRGERSITLNDATGVQRGHVLRIGAANAADEEFGVAAANAAGNSVQLCDGLLFDHANGAPVQPNSGAGAAANKRSIAPNNAAMAGDGVLVTQTGAGAFAPGDVVAVFPPTAAAPDFNGTQDNPEVRKVSRPTRLGLEQPSYADYPRGARVERITLNAAIAPFRLEDDAAAGATVVRVADRSALAQGDLLEIGLGTDRELLEIAQLLPPMAPAPNPGRVQLRGALRLPHPAADGVVTRRQAAPAPTHATSVLIDAPAGATSLTVAGAAGLANGDFVRVVLPSGSRAYHALAAAGAVTSLTPAALTLDGPLASAKSASSGVYDRVPMMEVRALDAGSWGNRLRVAMEPHRTALLGTTVRATPPGGTLRLTSAAGVEAGTELEISDGANPPVRVKVAAIDLQNDYLITLEAGTPLPGWVTGGVAVRSIEYRMEVELLRQPDPANPSRNNTAIDRESFSGLSLDPRHSRYFQRVIGCTWNMANPAITLDDMGRPLRRADRRSEGESAHVRVRDIAPTSSLRPGPVASYETRPDGTRRLVLLALANGQDQLGSVTRQTYIGDDNTNPEQRTGMFALRNIEEISIVAVPGRTEPEIQAALINHCEFMRYRFAVLDGNPPPNDAMANIQYQRQQFDTKYAALYHPWLLVPDPYPATAAGAPDYAIPPSGHMVGIYARTDIERGVHKAPANEVVRGVIGLQRILNKEQHDILNPYPVNINVIRDFRPNNRGIRVYGGRCITSDSDWKYVNVRRLLIFIEASIDRGLQWVVFEPNAEPLWARVRRAIANFLTLVWRNGALEGTKVEEAFFVKCDRTTMTQTDIDQGRLICLVGVAPVKPAEFVIVRIGLWTAHAEE
jgi:phage tail sheath protein FI